MKKITAYECEVCETAYFEEKEAKTCEKYHLDSDKMVVADCFYTKANNQFPDKILVDCSNHSGVSALYVKTEEGSFKEFSYLYPEEEDL